MTIRQLLLATTMLGALAGMAFLVREAEAPGMSMTVAAEKFLGSLDAKQKGQATFDFGDEERTRWYFTPQQSKGKALRKGLPLADMTPKQQELARALLRAGTSEAGYKKATTVISLESILADLEKGKGMVRDPQWYFFSVFGQPTKSGRWGWRIEGHHLSINFTVEAGKVITATPFFLGSNPAVVKSGKYKGLEALPETAEPFRELVKALDADQRKLALQKVLVKEIDENVATPSVKEQVGLPADKMTEAQKSLLWKLIEGYAMRMPAEVAAAELAEIKKTGLDRVTFAYTGSEGVAGKPYAYRVHGPTFLIEFINEQADSARNPANHIHSAWRNARGDFGLAKPKGS